MDLLARAILTAAVVGSLTALPAAAQETAAAAPPTDQQPKPAKNPNEVVCERQRELGSRLAAEKVCHTRAEWADLRSQDRQELDRVQTRRGMQGR